MYKAATFIGKSSFSLDQFRLGRYFVHTHAHIILIHSYIVALHLVWHVCKWASLISLPL